MRYHIKKAQILEKSQKSKEAIYEYIAALKNNEEMNDDDLLNATLLFFLAQDYGFITQYDIDDYTQSLAWEYYSVSLSKIKNNAEADFWRLYIPFILIGEPAIDETQIQELLKIDETPVIFILSSDQTDLMIEKVKILNKRHNPAKTERSRYINSIINKYL